MNALCLDCGNTRLKWGLWDGRRFSAQGALAVAELAALEVAAGRIVACNVAGDAGRRAIEALARRLGTPLDWVGARDRQCGVSNGYDHPAQLGADRWAALIGARARHGGACLVVNAGTATTVDVLDDGGGFRGGLILPGLAMMREALAAGTANLPIEAGAYRDLPTNTFDAIASGCVQATAGAIERMFKRVAAFPGAVCLLSGGAAPVLAPQLAMSLQQIDNLVLEGIARIAADAWDQRESQ
jgi:type III pantothenate kinase